MLQPQMMPQSQTAVCDRATTDATQDFAADVVEGLGRPRKHLDSKYFYDQRGAALFDRICDLPEYYLTRCEIQIMRAYGAQMATAIGPDAVIVELGSGSAMKTRLLLDRLDRPAAYVPIDISAEQLNATARSLAVDYAHLEIAPVYADFTNGFELPDASNGHRRVVYFPGSTVGNLDRSHAARFLARMRGVAGNRGGLLIGLDLKKHPATLHAAYNDAAGVTAQFNLNMLHRINRELSGTFDPRHFAHYAFYNPEGGRVEMHLVSSRRQTASAAGVQFSFATGESILTEYSCKYDPEEFTTLARTAGFRLRRMWLDDRRWFSVMLFDAA